MRASWSALHSSFIRVLNRTTSEIAFKAIGLAHPELAPFVTIASLMDHQHGRGSDVATRFRVIRVLVAAAQSDASYRSTAQALVIIALWPGLDAVFWRLARGFPSAGDDLAAEILARLGEAIATLDLDKVTAVTATLLRNLERDIRRDLIGDRISAAAIRPVDDPAIEAAVAEATAVDEGTAEDVADCLVGIARQDAVLLQRVFILGETQEEAGLALGLTHDAARKRIQRALRKIRSRKKSLPVLSHFDVPLGL